MITISEPDMENQAPDFDNPLGLISACHERILFHCDLLEKIMVYIAENKVDKELIDAAQRVNRYFNTAGKLHHQDEEEDIFPRIAKVSIKLAGVVNSLKQDHTTMDTLWSVISMALNEPHSISSRQLNELTKTSVDFSRLNREHIQTEEKELLVIAARLFNSSDLKNIGQAMKERRRL